MTLGDVAIWTVFGAGFLTGVIVASCLVFVVSAFAKDRP